MHAYIGNLNIEKLRTNGIEQNKGIFTLTKKTIQANKEIIQPNKKINLSQKVKEVLSRSHHTSINTKDYYPQVNHKLNQTYAQINTQRSQNYLQKNYTKPIQKENTNAQ